eukprot:CAMPEP_0202339716 /NCGR_PEP_ID=MMETSP1126-20121109/1460_1 /ASSEMBLY_ACC=CAM_ASM_000457 /TAXON_ID=3047 /ORGANISM="Dunaliella tertiolecta, Strain CCMP1320" /LENGTH=52 /DNA_ID=CAMNT_0048930309 /DNA_START=195 /DNA_END=353 /DNA_ORIENTATION=+
MVLPKENAGALLISSDMPGKETWHDGHRSQPLIPPQLCLEDPQGDAFTSSSR